MKNQILKIELLLESTTAPMDVKKNILNVAKRSYKFGYKPQEIIIALEMGLDIQNGSAMNLVSLPGTGYNKSAASFFLEYILPILIARRFNNYAIRILGRTETTLNLN